MNRLITHLDKSLLRSFERQVYKSYRIDVQLTDVDKTRLINSDTTGETTLTILKIIHKHYPQILNYGNDDASGIIKGVIRLHSLNRNKDSLQTIIQDIIYCNVSSVYFHKFIVSFSDPDLDDSTVSTIMEILEVNNNLQYFLSTSLNHDRYEIRVRIRCLSKIYKATKHILIIGIPTYLYKADICHLEYCTKMVKYIPKDIDYYTLNSIMSTKDNNTLSIDLRTIILRALHSSNLNSTATVRRLFPAKYATKRCIRDAKCVKSINVAYCLIIEASLCKSLSSLMLRDIIESIEYIISKGPLAPVDIIQDIVLLQSMLDSIYKSELYNSYYNWLELISIDGIM